jgi:hypothetical protein
MRFVEVPHRHPEGDSHVVTLEYDVQSHVSPETPLLVFRNYEIFKVHVGTHEA